MDFAATQSYRWHFECASSFSYQELLRSFFFWQPSAFPSISVQLLEISAHWLNDKIQWWTALALLENPVCPSLVLLSLFMVCSIVSFIDVWLKHLINIHRKIPGIIQMIICKIPGYHFCCRLNVKGPISYPCSAKNPPDLPYTSNSSKMQKLKINCISPEWIIAICFKILYNHLMCRVVGIVFSGKHNINF